MSSGWDGRRVPHRTRASTTNSVRRSCPEMVSCCLRTSMPGLTNRRSRSSILTASHLFMLVRHTAARQSSGIRSSKNGTRTPRARRTSRACSPSREENSSTTRIRTSAFRPGTTLRRCRVRPGPTSKSTGRGMLRRPSALMPVRTDTPGPSTETSLSTGARRTHAVSSRHPTSAGTAAPSSTTAPSGMMGARTGLPPSLLTPSRKPMMTPLSSKTAVSLALEAGLPLTDVTARSSAIPVSACQTHRYRASIRRGFPRRAVRRQAGQKTRPTTRSRICRTHCQSVAQERRRTTASPSQIPWKGATTHWNPTTPSRTEIPSRHGLPMPPMLTSLRTVAR